MKTVRYFGVGLLALSWFVSGQAYAPEAQAGVAMTDPSLPPVGCTYRGDPLSQVANYTNVTSFKATEIRLTDFRNINRTTSGGDEILNFDVTLTAMLIEALQVPVSPPVPVTFDGPLVARVFGKAGQTTGTWAAEIESANCTGMLGGYSAMLRESPTLPSLGSTTITDLGGGIYGIDSFFDVCTELSVDGGAHWLPDDNAPHHMILVPEPATVSLVVIGAVALLTRRRSKAIHL